MSFVGITLGSLLLASGGIAEGTVGVRASDGPRTAESMVRRVERVIDNAVREESERFVLVADSRYGSCSESLGILERTAEAVEEFVAEMVDDPRPLRERVIAVGFSDAAGFEHFARHVDGLDATWMSGYWTPGADRIVFRDARATAFSGAGQRGVFATEGCDPKATIAHEAAHVLLHRYGAQRRSPGAPLWISEGLAIAFEPCAHGSTEPFAPQPEREVRVRSRVTFALRDLVVATRLPTEDASAVRAFYDESWSLARWLWTQHPAEFRQYLSTLRQAAGKETARGTVPTSLAAFERAFGSIDAVESAWRRSISEAVAGELTDRAP